MGGWTYIGVSFAALRYKDTSYQSKVCAYIWGPRSFERSGCALTELPYNETWALPNVWETRFGQSLSGYIKTIYLWDAYKALTNLYYTPRRNEEYRLLDRCTAYSN
jgi:hypothetical protein